MLFTYFFAALSFQNTVYFTIVLNSLLISWIAIHDRLFFAFRWDRWGEDTKIGERGWPTFSPKNLFKRHVVKIKRHWHWMHFHSRSGSQGNYFSSEPTWHKSTKLWFSIIIIFINLLTLAYGPKLGTQGWYSTISYDRGFNQGLNLLYLKFNT